MGGGWGAGGPRVGLGGGGGPWGAPRGRRARAGVAWVVRAAAWPSPAAAQPPGGRGGVDERVATAHPLAPSALVSVQADFEIEGRPLLLGAPALVGRRGEAASLLVPPF